MEYRQSELLTPREAAIELRCTAATVRRRLRAGDLGGVLLGKRWMVPEEELRALRTHHRTVPTPGRHRRLADRNAA